MNCSGGSFYMPTEITKQQLVLERGESNRKNRGWKWLEIIFNSISTQLNVKKYNFKLIIAAMHFI